MFRFAPSAGVGVGEGKDQGGEGRGGKRSVLGRVKLLSAAGSNFFAISKWRMTSNLLPKKFRNHNNLNCDRIFLAKHQLS